MRITKTLGVCVGCGGFTHTMVSGEVYACINCLNQIGKETRYVREYLETFSDTFDDVFMRKFLTILSLMKNNNITTVDNIIKTLDAIKYYNAYKDGSISAEDKQKIEKQLDIFNIL